MYSARQHRIEQSEDVKTAYLSYDAAHLLKTQGEKGKQAAGGETFILHSSTLIYLLILKMREP